MRRRQRQARDCRLRIPDFVPGQKPLHSLTLRHAIPRRPANESARVPGTAMRRWGSSRRPFSRVPGTPRLLDRDILGDGDFGDFGVSLIDCRLVFGIGVGSEGATACGTTDVVDDAWHHAAFTRRFDDRRLQIWLDGRLDATVLGPTGDVFDWSGSSG